MTTRREFTQGSLAALIMSLLGTVTFAEAAEPATDEVRLYQTLLDVRDMLTPYRDNYDLVGAHPNIALLNVDWMLMKLCPHDPAEYTYSTEPRGYADRLDEYVTCPRCGVTVNSLIVGLEKPHQAA